MHGSTKKYDLFILKGGGKVNVWETVSITGGVVLSD